VKVVSEIQASKPDYISLAAILLCIKGNYS
jgi:hypothetical protein